MKTLTYSFSVFNFYVTHLMKLHFHGNRFSSIKGAVNIYARYQVRRDLHGVTKPVVTFYLATETICHKSLQVFFFYLGFFHDHSRITRLQGKGEGIFLAPHYQFHLLHGYLDICRAIISDSFPLHIASSQTRTGNYWFPSASC